jgi:hypothetical protein
MVDRLMWLDLGEKKESNYVNHITYMINIGIETNEK